MGQTTTVTHENSSTSSCGLFYPPPEFGFAEVKLWMSDSESIIFIHGFYHHGVWILPPLETLGFAEDNFCVLTVQTLMQFCGLYITYKI